VIDLVDVGDKTPELTLFDLNFKQRSLKEFRGKKLILAFFPGAFTSVCKKEMCTLRDDLAKLEKLDAQVIGVSVNDPFSLRGFHEDNALNFPLLSDYTREAIKIYGIELPNFAGLEGYTVAKRSIFVIDKEGILRWKWVSDNPGVEPDYAEIRRQMEKF
jgi:peroxiredoxin